MNASRADRAGGVQFRRRVAPALLALLMASPALAQAPGGPIRLGPPGSVIVPVTPAPPPAAATPETPIIMLPPPVAVPESPPARPGAIQATPLAAPDPDGAGLLEPAQGGLGVLAWQGVPRGAVLRLLPELPLTVPSPAARDLMRRLLLTDAAGPQPALEEAPPLRRLGALRVEALAGMGDPRAARDLAARLPGVLEEDETALRAIVDAQLLAGTLDCPWALEAGQPFPAVYWRRLDVFCRASSGDRDGARLMLELLRDSGDGDETFRTLAEAMIGGATAQPPRGLADAPPLTLAMMRQLALPVPVDVAAGLDPARLAAVSRMAATDATTRVDAAERAATALLLDSRALADAYRAAPSRGDEVYRVKELAAIGLGARVRGLVQQAFAGAMDGNRRLALVALALDLLAPPMWAGPPGAVVASMLDTLSVTVESAALAPAAVRLYEAQGRADAARRWRDLAVRTGAGPRLWPLTAASGQPAAGLSPWLDESLRSPDPAAEGRVAGTLRLLQALGAEVPEDAIRRAGLELPAPSGDPQRWAQLDLAAKNGRVGETALLALVLMGEGGPAGTPPAALARLVAALRAVGLDGEARALAREAIAAQGL